MSLKVSLHLMRSFLLVFSLPQTRLLRLKCHNWEKVKAAIPKNGQAILNPVTQQSQILKQTKIEFKPQQAAYR